ncbi:hypothetical protein Taro_023587 [Colocasia esculenta]|uniref:Uncharacterized protein n=1 Tax=Colocasia esculenta TaxID=4460 RepID=A0A843VB94_COLES|nr:hypothetical protein [Colocasia esculenta]
MAVTVGVKEEGLVDEVAEPVGGLELQDAMAWGCGLCQGHLPAATAAAVVAVAGTVAGRAGTVVVVVAAVVVVVAVVAAAVAFAVVVVASDPAGPKRWILGSLGSIGLSRGKAILTWRDLRVLALVLGRVLTLRVLLFAVVPWFLRLLSVWRSAYRALGVSDCTDLLIGLDPLSNWALRLLDITGFWGLKHGVYGRVLELSLNKTGSAVVLVHGRNVIHGQYGPVGWGGIGDQQLDFLLFRHGAADFRSQRVPPVGIS